MITKSQRNQILSEVTDMESFFFRVEKTKELNKRKKRKDKIIAIVYLIIFSAYFIPFILIPLIKQNV